MITLLTALRRSVKSEFRTSLKGRRNYDSTHRLFLCALKMVPSVGFEPTSVRLRVCDNNRYTTKALRSLTVETIHS